MHEDPRLLDMTPDGRFREVPRVPGVPLVTRIIIGAVVLAVLTAALAMAAFALWIAMLLIPVAIGAAIVAYALIRFRLWRARRHSPGSQGYAVRKP